MTTTPRHLDDFSAHAKTYLRGAQQAITDLADLRTGMHNSKQVADLYDRINQAMKLADVCAQIAIADRLHAVVVTIDAHRLTPDEIDALVTLDGTRVA